MQIQMPQNLFNFFFKCLFKIQFKIKLYIKKTLIQLTNCQASQPWDKQTHKHTKSYNNPILQQHSSTALQTTLATNSQQHSQKQDSMHSIISSSKSWWEIEHCDNWEFCYAIFMNLLLLLGVSGVSLLQLKWVSPDWAILESLRKVTLGRMNWILGLKTVSGDVRCSWQWFPKPWKSTWPTVVCFSFPGKKPKPEFCHVLRINLQSNPFSSWFYCSMALLSLKCLCIVTVYSIRELNQCMGILNLICVLLWRNMEKEKAQCFVDCATKLSMWWESSGSRIFFSQIETENSKL